MERFLGSLKNSHLTLFLIEPAQFEKRLDELVASLTEWSERPCYVTLSRPALEVERTLRQTGADVSAMTFIDASAAHYRDHSATQRTIRTPLGLTELRHEIHDVLRTVRPDYLIVDDVSCLLAAERPFTVARETLRIADLCRASGCRVLLASAKHEQTTALSAELWKGADSAFSVE